MGPRALLTERPEGRPGRTALGHVLEIENDEGLVIGLVGLYPDAVSAARVGVYVVLKVGAHDKLIVAGYMRSQIAGTAEQEDSHHR